MSLTSLESRIAYIRDLAQRGSFGPTLAARDAVLIIELALRELLRRYQVKLPDDKQREVGQAIANAAKGSRAKGLGDLTLGQLVGVIRDTGFFDAWSAATGQPLIALRLINLNALIQFRNKELTHVESMERLTDPAAQVSPADAQFVLYCVDLIINTFGILSLEDIPPEPDAALLARLPPPAESPYLGLRPFTASQRHLFFGREADCDTLLARIQSQPFVVLVGNSGSGKSSLVAAGLLPRLPAEEWLTLSLKPGSDLIDTLAGALVPSLYPDPAEQGAQREPLAHWMAQPDYRLDHLLEGFIAGDPQRRFLLVVDQFEEVFTLCDDRQRQRQAVELLLSILHTGAAGSLILLLVLRADFFGRCLDLGPLQQALDRWPPLTLGPMGPEQLRAAITCPAEKCDLGLEVGLAETIVEEVGDEPGHLPLLQTALDELWQRSDHRHLTHQGYRAVGGVAQALARKADEFLSGYNDEGRERLRRIFVQLVRPGEGEEDIRQIATQDQVGAENWDLVSRLANERLVVTGRDTQGQETVELIHEALIRHWPPLQQWVAQNRQFRVWQNRLRLDLQEWQQHDHDPSALLRGARLAEAEERLHQQADALSSSEQAYIQAGIAEREREERMRRRGQRRLIGGLTVGLLVMLALAGFAFFQWNQAAQEKSRAEKAREVATLARGQAEGLINYMLFDLRDKLKPVGRLDLLEGVAKKAGEYFEKLPSEDVSKDSERNRSVNLKNQADVQKDFGNLSVALELYQKALAIDDWLAQQNPANTRWQDDLALSHNRIGDVRQEQGDLAGALAAFQSSLAIAERLAQQDLANAQWQSALSVSHDRIGKVRRAQGDLAGALAAYQASLTIRERPAQQDPANAEWQLNLSISYEEIGDVRQAQGDLAGALAAYQSSLAIAERLAQQDPANAEWQHSLAVSHHKIGAVRQEQGDWAEALAAHQAALSIVKRLVQQDPANAQWQHDLSVCHQRIGYVWEYQDDLAKALTAHQTALAIVERLVQQNPANAQWQHSLTVSHERIGKVRQAQRDLAGALAAYEASLAICQRLTQRDPTNAEWQWGLSASYYRIGEVRQAQGDLAGALAAYQAAQAITERLVQQDPTNAGWQRDLGVSHNMIGTVRQRQNDLAGALADYQASLAIADRLAQQNPANAEWQSHLSVSYENIGGVRRAQGDLAGALAAYQASLAIRERLAQQDPTHAEWQHDLSVSHEKIGDVRQAQGDLAGALAAFQSSLAIAERLAQQDPAHAGWQRGLSVSHEKIGRVRQAQGEVRQAQGDLAGALAAYQESLAIRQRLAQQNPANVQWQRDLAVSHERIGAVRQAQGDLTGALAAYKAYQTSLAIRQRLVRQDPANPEWQRDLAGSYMNIGTVRQAHGDLAGALAAYQASLAIRQRLAQQDPANAQWQHDLAVSHERIGTVRQAQGDISGALDAYKAALTIARDLHAKLQNDFSRPLLANALSNLSFTLLFDHQFKEAAAAAEEALALNPSDILPATNQAHGYLLSDQFEKAEAIYRQHARDKLNDQQTFAEAVLDDFAKLRQHGIDHPDMKKIEALLRTSSGQP